LFSQNFFVSLLYNKEQSNEKRLEKKILKKILKSKKSYLLLLKAKDSQSEYLCETNRTEKNFKKL